jgi:hypothetical protein
LKGEAARGGLARELPRLVLLALLWSGICLAGAADQPPADWMPAGLEQLAKTASSHTDFSFDKNMLQLGGGLVDGGDPETRAAIAKLNGITVHLYRYAEPGMYDARELEAIRSQYHAAGWKHLVGNQSHAGAAGAPATGSNAAGASGLAAPYAGPGGAVARALAAAPHTDLYIKFQGADVVGMVLVQAGERNLNIVALSGDLSPLDLLHLRGHFGIPKFGGDGFTAAED